MHKSRITRIGLGAACAIALTVLAVPGSAGNGRAAAAPFGPPVKVTPELGGGYEPTIVSDRFGDAERRASYAAKERGGLSWKSWADRLQKYYSHLEALFSPDLFIVGGGVSKHHEEFLPLLHLQTPIVPAVLRNNAGILGAAALAVRADR